MPFEGVIQNLLSFAPGVFLILALCQVPQRFCITDTLSKVDFGWHAVRLVQKPSRNYHDLTEIDFVVTTVAVAASGKYSLLHYP